MKVYLCNYKMGIHIPFDNPQEATFDAALLFLRQLGADNSFLGVHNTPTTAVQFMHSKVEGRWFELLDFNSGIARGATINLPIAELILQAVYAGSSIEHILADHFIELTEEMVGRIRPDGPRRSSDKGKRKRR